MPRVEPLRAIIKEITMNGRMAKLDFGNICIVFMSYLLFGSSKEGIICVAIWSLN